MGPCVRRDDSEIYCPVTPLLDLFDQSTRVRLPAKLPRALRPHPAVRCHRILRRALAPLGGRFCHRHRRRRSRKTQHAVDGLAGFAHRILAVLGEVEAARRGLLDGKRVEGHEIVDMHVRPDVLAGSGMRRVAALFCQPDQQRHLHAVRSGAKACAVDQARADDDRPAALVAVGENELVQRDPRHARGRRRDRRVFVEDRI